MDPFIIETHRLELIAASCEMAEAELAGRSEFSKLLNAEIPENWPPAGNDESTMKWFLDRLNENPANRGWLAWYIVLKNEGQRKRVAVGGIGFKGAPDENGVAETGYGIMETFQRKGYASEALQGILKWAFRNPELKMVIAETDEENEASLGVLLKNGFRFAGPGGEDGTIRYEKTREGF